MRGMWIFYQGEQERRGRIPALAGTETTKPLRASDTPLLVTVKIPLAESETPARLARPLAGYPPEPPTESHRHSTPSEPNRGNDVSRSVLSSDGALPAHNDPCKRDNCAPIFRIQLA